MYSEFKIESVVNGGGEKLNAQMLEYIEKYKVAKGYITYSIVYNTK